MAIVDSALVNGRLPLYPYTVSSIVFGHDGVVVSSSLRFAFLAFRVIPINEKLRSDRFGREATHAQSHIHIHTHDGLRTNNDVLAAETREDRVIYAVGCSVGVFETRR
jgi:hypothetical protein